MCGWYSFNLLRLMLLRHLELLPAPSLLQLYRLRLLSARRAVVLKEITIKHETST